MFDVRFFEKKKKKSGQKWWRRIVTNSCNVRGKRATACNPAGNRQHCLLRHPVTSRRATTSTADESDESRLPPTNLLPRSLCAENRVSSFQFRLLTQLLFLSTRARARGQAVQRVVEMDFFFETELGNGYPTDGIQSWKRSIAIYDLRYLSLFSSLDKTILLFAQEARAKSKRSIKNLFIHHDSSRIEKFFPPSNYNRYDRVYLLYIQS